MEREIVNKPEIVSLYQAIEYLVKEAMMEDFIYNIREIAMSRNDGFEGSSWDHPDVLRYAKACKILSDFLDS